MKTRITELFGIQYPIIQGAMQWLSKPRLAAAVSNAGGLGTINMTTYATPEDFQAAIQELKSLTDRPFSVNLSLLPDTKPDGPIKGFLQAVVEEKVKIVETAGSSPAPLMDTLKGAGCLVMHKIPDSRFAHTAQEVGCDAVCIVGYEGGGHPGMAGVGSIVQWPLTTERCTLPVVGAGGRVRRPHHVRRPGRRAGLRLHRGDLHHVAQAPAGPVPHAAAAGLGLPAGRAGLPPDLPPLDHGLRAQRRGRYRHPGGRAGGQRDGVQPVHVRRAADRPE